MHLEDFIVMLVPLLAFGFCWWRASALTEQRTSRNSRLLARKLTPLIAINICIAAAVTLIGVIACFDEFVRYGEIVELRFCGVLVAGVLLALATIPLFKMQASLRKMNEFEVDLPALGIVAVSDGFKITLWGIFTAVGLFLGVLLGFGVFIVFIVLMGLIPMLFWQRGRTREGQFLWLLALSVRNNHDLAEEVENHAATWRGSYNLKLRQLVVYLRAGRPLGVALDQVPELLPHWIIASIKIGEETGTLGDTLNECAVAQLNWAKERFRSGSVASLLIYTASYPLVLLAPVSFIMYYIVPKFKSIFAGFGMELPSSLRMLIHLSDVAVNYCILIVPSIFIGTVILLRLDHTGWRNVRSNLLRRFYPRYDAAPVLRHLARGIDRGSTLPDGLLAIAKSYHRPSIAESMAQVYVDTESGGDCWDSLRGRGFLSRQDVSLIEAAQRNSNLPWALREIAEIRERRYLYRVDTVAQLIRPAIVLSLGLLVGWICVALFFPVIALMNGLS